MTMAQQSRIVDIWCNTEQNEHSERKRHRVEQNKGITTL
jgi:hypothetical protein